MDKIIAFTKRLNRWNDNRRRKQAGEEGAEALSPLSELTTNATGTVAYLHTDDHPALQRMIAMGLLPGTPIAVIQRFPAIAFQAGKSQFAVDKELAGKVVVRRSGRW